MNRTIPTLALAAIATPAIASFSITPSYEAYFYAGSGPRVNDRLIVNDGGGTPFEANGLIQFDISSLAGPLPAAILTFEKYNNPFLNGSTDESPVQIDLFVSSRDVSGVISDDDGITDPNEYSSWLANDVSADSVATAIIGDDGFYSFDLTAAVNAALTGGASSIDFAIRGTQINFDDFHNPYFATSLDTGRLAPTLAATAVPAPGVATIALVGGLAATRRRR